MEPLQKDSETSRAIVFFHHHPINDNRTICETACNLLRKDKWRLGHQLLQ